MTAAADAGVVMGRTPRGGLLIAAWSAVLGTVLSFARAPLTGEFDLPQTSGPPEAIIGFFRGSNFDAAFVGGMVMACIGWLLYLVFIAKVADLLQAVDVKYRFVGYLMMGGTVLNIGTTLGYVATLTVGVSSATGAGVGTDVLVILFGFIWTLIYLGTLVWALVAIPMGYAVVRTAFIPRWMGWAILIILAANLAANFMPFEVSSVTGGLPYLWMLTAGMMLLIQSNRYQRELLDESLSV